MRPHQIPNFQGLHVFRSAERASSLSKMISSSKELKVPGMNGCGKASGDELEDESDLNMRKMHSKRSRTPVPREIDD